MAPSHSPRSRCQERRRQKSVKFLRKSGQGGLRFRGVGGFPHGNVAGEPLGDAQLADFHRDFLSVARFGDSDGCQVLRGSQENRSK